ncbi:MAG: hypothetical protein IJX99_02570 [Clostridia bacterium]|nr:hypothetical protein [Clostridia bacterium]
MNKVEKICLSMSCFILLYGIFLLKNILKIKELFGMENFCWKTSQEFRVNVIMIGVFLICIILSLVGIIIFRNTFLSAYNEPSEKVIIERAENITSDYFFTYFSLFILTFFSTDSTSLSDMGYLTIVMFFIIWVYVKNDMWFINPTLNVLGYKSFKIICKQNDKIQEINVFSKENLCKNIGEHYNISYSTYDFSVCYKKVK